MKIMIPYIPPIKKVMIFLIKTFTSVLQKKLLAHFSGKEKILYFFKDL